MTQKQVLLVEVPVKGRSKKYHRDYMERMNEYFCAYAQQDIKKEYHVVIMPNMGDAERVQISVVNSDNINVDKINELIKSSEQYMKNLKLINYED